LSKKEEDERWAFRFYLKSSDVTPEKINDIVHELYKQISSRMDCKICGNCCREVQPLLDDEDIEKLSFSLGVFTTQFRPST